MLDDTNDFIVDCFRTVDSVSKKYRANPEAVFAIQCEIIAAGYLLKWTNPAQNEISKKLKMSDQFNGPNFYMLKGAIAHIEEQGVGTANAKDYLKKRLSEFEQATKSHGIW
ncbi:MAG TPA: hypothetical protein VMJ32_05285 [Pirellulales bacterium]|nr:hypothetical protein [Pirellulales bacterium]